MVDLLTYTLRVSAFALALLGAFALLGGAMLVGWRQVVRRRRVHAENDATAVDARIATGMWRD